MQRQQRTQSRPRNNCRRGAGRRTHAATYMIVSSLALNSATNKNHAVVEARSSLRRATHDSTTHFCGPSWMDVRDNCALRQPCPTKLDNECNDPSHFCWGDTFCDPTQEFLEEVGIAKGEEARIAMEQLLVLIDADDPMRFNSCGVHWSDASARCGQWCSGESSECPGDQGCFPDTSCYTTVGL